MAQWYGVSLLSLFPNGFPGSNPGLGVSQEAPSASARRNALHSVRIPCVLSEISTKVFPTGKTLKTPGDSKNRLFLYAHTKEAMPVFELTSKNIVVIDSVFFDNAERYLLNLPTYLIYTHAMWVPDSRFLIMALTELEFSLERISREKDVPSPEKLERMKERYNSSLFQIASDSKQDPLRGVISMGAIETASRAYTRGLKIEGGILPEILVGRGTLPENLPCPDHGGLKIARETIKLAKEKGAEVYIYGSSFYHPVHELTVMKKFSEDIDMFYLNRFIEDKETKSPMLELRVTDTAKAFDDPAGLPLSYSGGFFEREVVYITNKTNPLHAYAPHNPILTPNLKERLEQVLS